MNPLTDYHIGMFILILILLILAIMQYLGRPIMKYMDRLKVRKYPLTPDQTFDNLEPATIQELIQDDLSEANSCITAALYRVQQSNHNQRVKHEIYLKEMLTHISWLMQEYNKPAPIEEYPTYTQHKQNQ